MQTAQPVLVRITRYIDAPPERVFDAWLDPEQVRPWMMAAYKRAGLGELVRVEIDARVGGSYSFVFRSNGTEIEQTGAYLEIDRPRRLAFTWLIALPDVERIIITTVPAGAGCDLTLTHEMDPSWSGDAAPVEAAWAIVLDAMAGLLEGGATAENPATPSYSGGRNIAMKVPPHQWEETVRFYRDVLGLRTIDHAPTTPPSVCFEFGANRLWIDCVTGMSQAELWLEIVTDDAAAAAEHLEAASVVRYDEIEPLPEGFPGFWISNPASIIHIVATQRGS